MYNNFVRLQPSDNLRSIFLPSCRERAGEIVRRNPKHLLVSDDRDDISVNRKGRSLGRITGTIVIPRPAFAKMRCIKIGIGKENFAFGIREEMIHSGVVKYLTVEKRGVA